MEYRTQYSQLPRGANAVLNRQLSLLRYLIFLEKKKREQFSLIWTSKGTGRVPQQITDEVGEDEN